MSLAKAMKQSVGDYLETAKHMRRVCAPNSPDSLVEEIDRLQEELETYRALDTCMCGSPMEGHTWGDGHAPVSMYDYHLGCLEEENRNLKARIEQLIELNKVGNNHDSELAKTAYERGKKEAEEELLKLRQVIAKCHIYADSPKEWDGTTWRYAHPNFKKIVEVCREVAEK